MFFATKILVSALIIAGASELGKRHPWAGAILISLPLSSLLALSWMHVEASQASDVAAMAMSIFWMVIPSLVFFVALATTLRGGIPYWPALGLSALVTVGAYYGFGRVLKQFGIMI